MTALLACCALVAVAFGARAASSLPVREGDAGALGATTTLGCEPSEGAGRVRCEVEARVPAGRVLRWGDVVLVRAPDFVVPLRARIGPHEATTREPSRWRWAFAVVARERGRGPLDARVRLVVCRDEADGGEGPCTPVTLDVTTMLSVGVGKP